MPEKARKSAQLTYPFSSLEENQLKMKVIIHTPDTLAKAAHGLI